MKIKKYRGFGGLIFLAVFAAATAVVMLLWNCIIPQIIGWGVITYWQAAGILLLCKLLFGGFGRDGRFLGGRRLSREERARFREHISSMSAEERKAHIRRRMFGGGFCDCKDERQ